jgi:hypothetical protein
MAGLFDLPKRMPRQGLFGPVGGGNVYRIGGSPDDQLQNMIEGDTSLEGSFQPGEIEPMQITPNMGALEGGGRAGIRAYHSSRHDFTAFKPSEFRKATFFSATPKGAQAGASAGRNEMIMDTATVLPPVRSRTYEVNIDPTKIEGLHLRPREVEWFKGLPKEITSEGKFDKVWASRPSGITHWDDYYDAVPTGSGKFKYVKKAEPPSMTYEQAVTRGRDVYGQQWPHYSDQGNEAQSATRIISDGMGGWLVQDEGGLSIAVADPTIARILGVK